MKGVFENKKYEIDIHLANQIKAFPPMFHEHIEFVYVVEGTLSMQIDGVKHTLTSGEMALVFPYVLHSYEQTQNCKIYLLLFSPNQIGLFEKEVRIYKPQTPYLTHCEKYLPLFERIEAYSHSVHSEKKKTASAYLSAFMGEILVSVPMSETSDTDYSMAQKLLAYCSEKYMEPITVKSIAAHLYISESYVSKLFSQKLGYSFREYINELRIIEAKQLLKNTDLKIVDIMLHCGFQNQSSFNRVFMQAYHVSPREYRKQYRS